ncbi:MAG: HAD family phosphatase [archaeon]
MIKAIIFDLDGTLVLTENFNKNIFKIVCLKYGHKLEDKEYDLFFAGTKTLEGCYNFLKSVNADTSLAQDMVLDFRAIKRDVLKNKLKENIDLRSNTQMLLSKLKVNYKIALATSTIREFMNYICSGFEIINYFDEIVTGDDVIKSKPDPEIFLATAKKLNIDPKDCVVIEDAENGIIAAKSANMKCIAIEDKSFGERNLSSADYIIKDLIELNTTLFDRL